MCIPETSVPNLSRSDINCHKMLISSPLRCKRIGIFFYLLYINLNIVYEEWSQKGKIDKRRNCINSISFYNVRHFFHPEKTEEWGRRGTIMTQIWWLYQEHPLCYFAVPTAVHIFLPSTLELHGVPVQRPSHFPELWSDIIFLKDGWITYKIIESNMAKREWIENFVAY